MKVRAPNPILLFTLIAWSSCGNSDNRPLDVVDLHYESDSLACPDGLVAWASGHCAPAIDECEKWELALVGGGCVAIGPRACAKGWHPEADVDCEAGDLLPCPEGFELSDDEIACLPVFSEDCGEFELPELGGTCRRVGSSAAAYSGPTYISCPAGSMPVPDGGCLQPGPRACSKLWDPEADIKCYLGDVLPCPEGWQPNVDGLYCRPGYETCGPGELAEVGGGCARVVPLAEDCPVSGYPDPPEGVQSIVYVKADSDCEVACGTQEAPFASIQQAVNAVSPGGAVLVGAGLYAEGVGIAKPLHLLGVCAANTVITGTTSNPSAPPGLDLLGLGIFGTKDVTVRGLRIQSAAPGAMMISSSNCTLEKVEITESVGPALTVYGGGGTTIEDCWLHDLDVNPDYPALVRGGLAMADGAKVVARRLVIDSAKEFGVVAFDSDTMLWLEDSVVRNTQPNGPLGFGTGALVSDGAHVELARTLVEDSIGEGILVHKGSSLKMTLSAVRNTTSPQPTVSATGLFVGPLSQAVVSDSYFAANGSEVLQKYGPDVGLFATGQGAQMEVRTSVVLGDDGTSETPRGLGIVGEKGAVVLLEGTLVKGTSDTAIQVVGEGTKAVVAGSLLSGVVAVKNELFSAAALVSGGAQLEMSNSLVENSGGDGVFADQAKSSLTAHNLVVRGSNIGTDGSWGFGIAAGEGGKAAISDCLVEDNAAGGIVSWLEGSTVDVVRSEMRGTRADKGEGSPGALAAYAGAQLSAAEVVVSDNVQSGVGAYGQGSILTVSNSVVSGTESANAGLATAGLAAINGGHLTVQGVLIEQNQEFGLLVFGKQSMAEVTDTAVRETVPSAVDIPAIGVAVRQGAGLLMVGSTVEANPGVGVFVHADGAEAQFEDCLVRLNGSPDGGVSGGGFSVDLDSSASLRNCLVADNFSVGILTAGQGASLHLVDSAVRDTASNADGVLGHGVDVIADASAVVERTLMARNREAGILATGALTTMELTDSAVRDTLQVVAGGWGWGVDVAEGASAHVFRSLLDGNHEVGVFATDHGTALTLERSVVRNTTPGPDLNGGFGVYATDGADILLLGDQVVGNRDIGVVSHKTGTSVRAESTLVTDTQADPDGYFGNGMAVDAGAQMDVVRTLVADNDGAGVVAVTPTTVLKVHQAVISDTSSGMGHTDAVSMEEQAFGDGMYLGIGAQASVTDSVLADNARCGIYVKEAFALLTGNLIRGSGSFGLAMEDAAKNVEWSENGNYIFGNGVSLPAAQAADITENPTGLPPPPIATDVFD